MRPGGLTGPPIPAQSRIPIWLDELKKLQKCFPCASLPTEPWQEFAGKDETASTPAGLPVNQQRWVKAEKDSALGKY